VNLWNSSLIPDPTSNGRRCWGGASEHYVNYDASRYTPEDQDDRWPHAPLYYPGANERSTSAQSQCQHRASTQACPTASASKPKPHEWLCIEAGGVGASPVSGRKGGNRLAVAGRVAKTYSAAAASDVSYASGYFMYPCIQPSSNRWSKSHGPRHNPH
jgi:hypothetical protein